MSKFRVDVIWHANFWTEVGVVVVGMAHELNYRSQVITTGGYVRPLIEVNSHSTALYWNSFKWRINSINWMGCWVLDRENVRIISGRANVFYICRFITRIGGGWDQLGAYTRLRLFAATADNNNKSGDRAATQAGNELDHESSAVIPAFNSIELRLSPQRAICWLIKFTCLDADWTGWTSLIVVHIVGSPEGRSRLIAE